MFDDRLKKLARQLDRITERDRQRIQHEQEVEQIRREAAAGLHAMLADLVTALNELLHNSHLELAPAQFEKDQFQADRPTLFQINASGRVLQFAFQGTEPLVVSDDQKAPYTLAGTVHWYNQDMLERDELKEQQLYFCMDRHGNEWRYYDLRTRRSGKVDTEYIAGRLEELV